MQTLIKVTTTPKGSPVISARDLYSFLEVSEKFTDWIRRTLDFDFIENVDFFRIIGKSTGGRPATDFVLTIDAAKQISMLQRSSKGRQARLYFIECEKQLQLMVTPMLPATYAQALRSYADALEEAEQLKIQNQRLQEKAEFAETVMQSLDLVSVGEMAKTLAYSQVGQNKLFEFLREKRVLMPDNRPYQTAVDRGWCKVVNVPWNHPKEGPKIGLKTCFTAKGVDAVRRLLDTAGYRRQA